MTTDNHALRNRTQLATVGSDSSREPTTTAAPGSQPRRLTINTASHHLMASPQHLLLPNSPSIQLGATTVLVLPRSPSIRVGRPSNSIPLASPSTDRREVYSPQSTPQSTQSTDGHQFSLLSSPGSSSGALSHVNRSPVPSPLGATHRSVASTPISIPWSVMLSTSASDISAPPSPWGRRNRPPWSAPAFGGYHVEHRREQYSSSDLSPSTESFPATVSELDYDEYFKRSHSLDED